MRNIKVTKAFEVAADGTSMHHLTKIQRQGQDKVETFSSVHCDGFILFSYLL